MANRGVNVDGSDATSMLPSRTSRRHVALAKRALAQVRDALPLRPLAHPDRPAHHVSRDGMSGWLLGRFEQLWMVGAEAEAVAQRSEDAPVPAWLARLARLAQQGGDAGAGAQAVLAFSHLYELGVRPLDYMHVAARGYAYVLIGRADALSERRASHEDDDHKDVLYTPNAAQIDLAPEGWGEDAVVCDPFHGLVFRQPDLINTEHYHDYYPAESQLHLPRPRGEAHE